MFRLENDLYSSPTTDIVLWFASEMENKLDQNRHKTGWQHEDVKTLSTRLYEEYMELEELIWGSRDTPATAEEIISEAADVANFAMMIADVAATKVSV